MSLRIRRLAAAAVCLAAGFAGTVLLSPSAQAASGLTGRQHEFTWGVSSYAAKKTERVYCPAGKVVIGAGASVPGSPAVRITYIRAVGDGNYAEATAVNPTGRFKWALDVDALCADAPKGLEYVSANSGLGAGPKRTAVAKCSAGKEVLGLGGLAYAQTDRNVALSVMAPGRTQTSVIVESNAAEGGELNPWTTYAFATCADKLGATKAYTPGMTGTSGTLQTASAPCTPETLTAAGVVIRPSQPANVGQIGLTDASFDGTLGEAAISAREDANGYGGIWTVGAWSICVP